MKHVYFASFGSTTKFKNGYSTRELDVIAQSATQIVVTSPLDPEGFQIIGTEAGSTAQTWNLDEPDIRVYQDDAFFGTGVVAYFYSSVEQSPSEIKNAIGQAIAWHPSNLRDTFSLDLIK